MIHELSTEQLHRKISLCEEVLQVADIVSPGLSVLRGAFSLFTGLILYKSFFILYHHQSFEWGVCSKPLAVFMVVLYTAPLPREILFGFHKIKGG